jgi:hypothetical protein
MHLTNGEPRAAEGRLPLSDYALIARLCGLSQIAMHISLFSNTSVVCVCVAAVMWRSRAKLGCSYSAPWALAETRAGAPKTVELGVPGR